MFYQGDEIRMRCPTCVNEGLISKVTTVPITCMTAEVKHDHSYWDEKGDYHNHNHGKWDYKCSKGHAFTITDHCNYKDCCDKR